MRNAYDLLNDYLGTITNVVKVIIQVAINNEQDGHLLGVRVK